MIIPARIPCWVEKLFPQRIWRIHTPNKELYLTFDDGPHPRITPLVLDLLKFHNAKATFFCIGDRVKRYPGVYNRILEEGHAVGNHTHHHLNGWKTSVEDYMGDIHEAGKHIDTQLFRPPYGRMKYGQMKCVRAMGIKIVMWTVLSGDYDLNITPEDVSKRCNGFLEAGAIYLFHDSEKAEKKMFFALKKLLGDASCAGFSFGSIVI